MKRGIAQASEFLRHRGGRPIGIRGSNPNARDRFQAYMAWLGSWSWVKTRVEQGPWTTREQVVSGAFLQEARQAEGSK